MQEVSRSVIFTDLQKFSDLRIRIGDTKAFKILQIHDQILHKAILQFGGYVVKTVGDSIMAVFESPIDSIKCAVKIQQDISKHNKQIQLIDFNKIPPIRIGMCYGVMDELERFGEIDYLGTIVDRASRVNGLADGDHIFTTEVDIKLIEGRIAHLINDLIKLEYHGECNLRNIGIFKIVEILYKKSPEEKNFIQPQQIVKGIVDEYKVGLRKELLKFIKSNQLPGVDLKQIEILKKEFELQSFMDSFLSYIDYFESQEKSHWNTSSQIQALCEIGIIHFSEPEKCAQILDIFSKSLCKLNKFHQAKEVLSKALEIAVSSELKRNLSDNFKRIELAEKKHRLK